MNHQNGRKKLNLKSGHRKALLRNQLIHFIRYSFLQTTRARAKEVQKFAEKMVTVAKIGYNFNTIRTIKKEIPYDIKIVKKLIQEVAPTYQGRPGGYTRIIPIGIRESDTAKIVRLEWI